MKILHTSDWHFGQSFFGLSRLAEHQQLISWLLETIEQHSVDVVIIAGDIFDTGAPSSYARQIYNELVLALKSINCQLIMVAGNHDSVAVLNESQNLLAAMQTVLVNSLDQAKPTIHQTGSDAAVFLPIPFIRQRDLYRGDDKQIGLGQRISEVYHNLVKQAQAHELPIIATGHMTIMGASTSDSERDIYIGNLEALPANLLPEVDYLAMGHIHRPQTIAGKQHWRYSGSPIALSFSEATQQKSMVLIDSEQCNAPQLINIPTWQPLLDLSSNLDSLQDDLAAKLDQASGQTTWLSLHMAERRRDLADLVNQYLSDFPVQLLKLSRNHSELNASWHTSNKTIQEYTPEQIMQQRLALADIEDDNKDRLLDRFGQVLAQVRSEEQS